jgi:murein tripeptide amidase MpaA
MGDVHLLSQNDLTRAIAERLTEVWDAYVRVDEESHSKYLTEDYRAVHPDGRVHIGRPSAGEMAAEPIEDYWIADLQAWPVGDDGAIVSYTAEVEVRTETTSGRFQFIVGEVWIRRDGQWKCRYYHATMLK